MNKAMRKIAKILAEGLAVSARAAAWREGLPWEPDARRARRRAGQEHH